MASLLSTLPSENIRKRKPVCLMIIHKVLWVWQDYLTTTLFKITAESAMKIFKTRNTRLSLAYSPYGAVVSPPSECLWKALNYLSLQCVTAPPHSEHMWTTRCNDYRRSRTTSFFLNSGITEPNLTKFLQNIQKYCQLTCWNRNYDISIRFKRQRAEWTTTVKLQPSCGKNSTNSFLYSEVSGPMFTKFVHNVAESSLCDLFKAT